jgi:hypothetical protein
MAYLVSVPRFYPFVRMLSIVITECRGWVGEYIVSGQFLIQRTNKTRIWVPFQNLKSCKLLLGDWTGLLTTRAGRASQ